MISFFAPPGNEGHSFTLSQDTWKDLELGILASQLKTIPLPSSLIRIYLETLETDSEVILWKQNNLKFLLDSPEILKSLGKMTQDWIYLKESVTSSSLPPLKKVLRRLGELETWVKVVRGLLKIFESNKAECVGAWKEVKKLAELTSQGKDFIQLAEVLPTLRSGIQGIQGVSIGINLNHALEPVGAVLLTIESERFQGKRSGVLGRLFQNSDQPLGDLHHPPYKTLQVANQTIIQDPEEFGYAVNPKSLPLFRDLEEILKKTAMEMDKTLSKFSHLEIERWRNMAQEITLLVGSASLLQSWKEKGLPLVFPSIIPQEENKTQVDGMYHLPLWLKCPHGSEVVPQNMDWGDEGRVHVITGPNSGGKTIYLQNLGWAQFFAQLGWPLPAEKAWVSPAKSIGTHFQKEEETGRSAGSFGEEVARLKHIFTELKPGGVVLMNESLSGTNAMESYAIACDLMKAFRVKGARVGFTTHLHELAREVDELNQETPGPSKIASLVAQPGSFKVVFGPPSGRSQAREIAALHGLSFEQLCERP